MVNTVLTDSSRHAEESQIVANWLQRLQGCLESSQQPYYAHALRQARISDDNIERAENIRQSQLDHVLSEIRTVVPDITLRLFARAEILDLGLIGYAAVNSGTVGRALEVMYQYHSLASDRYVDNLELEGDYARVFPTPLPGYIEDYQNVVEDSFSGNWRALQVLLGPLADNNKIRLSLEHSAPDYLCTYREVFGPHCLFDQDQTALRFPRSWLDAPVNRSSGALSHVYTAMCERVLGPGDAGRDTPQVVRRLLLSRPGRQMLRLEGAAEQLRLSPGQLRKRLYRAGTTYKSLVLEIRMDLARHYLLDTHLSVQEIAYLLDYSQAAPFSRAFKQYCGAAPEHFRLAHTPGSVPQPELVR
jgi:AraC-like DNA-binding protein